MIIGVPAADATMAWPLVLPFVERYLVKSKEHRWNADDLLADVQEGDKQLWVVMNPQAPTIDSVVMTEIVNYPQCREANVFMVSGKMTTLEDWREITQELVDWAAQKGCHYISSMARRGSEKAMGWESRQTYIVKGI